MRLSVGIAAAMATAWCGLAAMAAAPVKGPKPAVRKPAPPQPSAAPGPAAAGDPARPAPEVVQFFEREVRPVLVQECYSCHTDKAQGGLRVDSRAALLKGGGRGPSLLEKDLARSPFLLAVRHQGLQMPPGKKLPERQIAALEKWVRMGAPWPGGGSAAAPKTWEDALRERKNWWSLYPVKKPAVPVVRNKKWSQHPVDLFLLDRMEKEGLKPAAPADRRTLIRRVFLVLTGLPPAPEQVEAFVNDRSPNAYEKLVDQVLATPQYGERFARHWMDVVRYGETHGYEWNYELRDPWRYRDYLIRAFNQDVPYDQFIWEHIAGDLLPNPRMNAAEHLNESAIGTAFYRFGENGHDVFKEIGLDVLDNQIDTLSKAFQAATITCARCHDHKLDAVSAKDYYALLGVLASSRQVSHTLDDPTVNAQPKEKLQALKGQIRSEISNQWLANAREVSRYLRAAQAQREKAPNAAELAQGLDAERVKAWVTVLEKRKPGLEDPLQAWTAAAEAAAKDPSAVSSTWSALAQQYQTENKNRAEFNSKNFVVMGDFTSGKPEGWRVAGQGLSSGPVKAGDFTVALEGDRAVTNVFPSGMFTHSLSEKLDGSIQSPWLPQDKKWISFEVLGNKQGVVRYIPDQRQLTDTGREIKSDRLQWVTVGRPDRDEWFYVELITKFHNPRFNENPRAKNAAPEDPRSYFGVTRAYLHLNGPEAPKSELGWALRLFGADAPKSLDEAAAAYSGALQGAVQRWSQGQATDDDARWMAWLVQNNLVDDRLASTPKLAELVSEYRKAETEIQQPRLVCGMADAPGFDVPLYRRGDYRQPGDMVPRGYVEVLSSADDHSQVTGTGRWKLAEEITGPRNPLTARVMVNRIWHWLYGTGIVKTVDDFGHMGEQPSHPELLDYLASRFTEKPVGNGPGGWSVKRMIRFLVLSQAFKMGSAEDPKLHEKDPENRLLHHYPARRMEAEAIRDSILSVSGRLDRSLYGPSIQPYRLDPKPERRLFGGPLDGDGRRSIYTKITLMEGPSFLIAFNFPDPKVAQGRRDVTNVPAQALTLLNDPLVLDQSGFWADRLVKDPDPTPTARLDRMFRAALGRAPRPAEVQRFSAAIQELATLNEVPAADLMKSRDVWKDVAHAVFNMKEFIYVK